MPLQADARQERRTHAHAAQGLPAPMLDTYREVVTPEGVALHLPAAGPVPRALAWGIDFAIRGTIMLVMGMLLGVLGGLGQGLYLVGMFLVFWAYPIVLEAAWHGQTPGKRVLGLRVVSGDGAPLGWLPAIVRNLLRTVDMLPFGYAAALVSCLCDRHGRRLGDRVADTVVVHVLSHRAHPQVPVVPPQPLPQPLQLPEQVALVAFGERSLRLAPARQAELADLLSPLTGARGLAGARQLLGMANWVLGRR